MIYCGGRSNSNFKKIHLLRRESLQEDHDDTHSKNTYITITAEIQHPQAAQETHHQ